MNVGLIQVSSRKSPTSCGDGQQERISNEQNEKVAHLGKENPECVEEMTLSRRRAVVLGRGHSTPFSVHRLSKNLRVSGDRSKKKKRATKQLVSAKNK